MIKQNNIKFYIILSLFILNYYMNENPLYIYYLNHHNFEIEDYFSGLFKRH